MNRKLYLILGGIASGKSSFASICPICSSQIEYLCSDLYKKAFFSEIEDSNKIKIQYRCADELLFFRIEELCLRGESFILEFCPTNRNKFETIKYYAKAYGYQIISYFVGTDNVDINITRNQAREMEGGDHVADQKVKIRYEDAFNSILEILCISKMTYFIDNSFNEYKVIGYSSKRKIYVFDDNCYWFNFRVKNRIK